MAGDKVRTLTPDSTDDQTRLPGPLSKQALPKTYLLNIFTLPTELTRAAGGFGASQEPGCFSCEIQRSIHTGNPICSCWRHTQINTPDTFRMFDVGKNIFFTEAWLLPVLAQLVPTAHWL